MNNASPTEIVLTDAQHAQFIAEMERFESESESRGWATDPMMRVVLSQVMSHAKSRPSQTVGLLVTLGHEISEAVGRIHTADEPQVLTEGEHSEFRD